MQYVLALEMTYVMIAISIPWGLGVDTIDPANGSLDYNASVCRKDPPLNVTFFDHSGLNRSAFRRHMRRLRVGKSDVVKTPLFWNYEVQNLAWRSSQDCTLRGFGFFVFVLDTHRYLMRAANKPLRWDSSLGGYPGLIAGVCVAAGCNAADVIEGSWPRIMGHIFPYLSAPFSVRPTAQEVICREYAVLVQKVRPKPDGQLFIRDVPLVPDCFIALAHDPVARLVDLRKQLQAYGLDRVDLRMSGQNWDRRKGHDSVQFGVPASVRHVVIDVGAALAGLEEPEFAEQLRVDASLLVIALEPLPAAFETLLNWSQKQSPEISARFWVWPLAVASKPGLRLLRQSGGDGQCSSLLPFSRHAFAVNADLRCVQEADHSLVPVLPLAELLEALPRALNISLVKVDAQGLDLDVVLSLGPAIRQIDAIMIEVQEQVAEGISADLTFRYEGQHSKQDVVGVLQAHGFSLEDCITISPEIGEQDCFFRNELLGRRSNQFSLDFMIQAQISRTQ